MNRLHAYLVEPVDPPIFGDGRSIAEGSWNASLPWPHPSTMAGAARYRLGEDARGVFDTSRVHEVLQAQVHGPHPVQVGADGRITWLFAAPADHQVVDATGEVVRAAPWELGAARCNDPELAPVGPTRLLGKPRAPADLWSWPLMERWLTDDGAALEGLRLAPGETAMAPPIDARIHVGLLSGSEVAKRGALFATAARAYWGTNPAAASPHNAAPARSEPSRLALVLRSDRPIREGLGHLGGERRMARWTALDEDIFPTVPDAVLDAAAAGHVRVVLTTPTWFRAGSRPDLATAFGTIGGQPPRLIAAAHGRTVVVSGWDFRHNRPKPTRRLVPAGAVYFLELPGTPEQRRAWAEAIWGQPICDQPCHEQARKHPDFCPRRSGFGVALLGTWSGRRLSLSSLSQRA